MKWLLFLLLFSSCIIDFQAPLIITKIERSTQKHGCLYTAREAASVRGFQFFDSVGKFNVGDTLVIKRK